MSINSRQKGKAGELEASRYLSQLFKLPVRRGCQYRGGPDSPDVEGIAGVYIEVKRRQRLHLETALSKAACEAAQDDVPIVLHRADRERWKLTLFGDDLPRFVEVCHRLLNLGERQESKANSPETEITPSRKENEHEQ